MNSKKLFFGTAILAAIGFGVVKAVKSSNAADKLDYDIDAFTLKKVNRNNIGAPIGLIYTIALKLNNPTDQDLIISKPYIKLSVKKNGTLKKIANTNIPEDLQINIKGKFTTDFKHDIEVRLSNLIGVMPNAINYVFDRINGDKKATQHIVADVTLDSLGITIPIQKTIAL